MDLSTFALPIVGHDLPPELGHNGLRFRGEVIPYTAIEKFVCSDNEVVVVFRADEEGNTREDMVFEVDSESVHQVYNSLAQIIYKHMRQKGIAKYAEDDVDRAEIINAPIVDTKRISTKNRGW
jgi:hypothetical protein